MGSVSPPLARLQREEGNTEAEGAGPTPVSSPQAPGATSTPGTPQRLRPYRLCCRHGWVDGDIYGPPDGRYVACRESDVCVIACTSVLCLLCDVM